MARFNERTKPREQHRSVAGILLTLLCVAAISAMPGCNDSGPPTPTQTAAEGTNDSPSASTRQLSPEVQAILASFPPVDVEPPTLDFGEVPLNAPVTRTVRLINSGEQNLRILNATSNCGCTTPDMSNVEIAPNSSVEVPVHFDAEGKTGNRSATVTIVFDDYERPIKFNIRAFVLDG